MKVLLVGDELVPDVGGAPVYADELSRAMAELGVEVVLMTHWDPGQPPEEEKDGVKIKRLKGFVIPRFNRAASPALFSRLHQEIKKDGYDVVHSLDLYSSMGCGALWSAKKLGKPSLFTCHTAHRPSTLIWISHLPLLRFIKCAVGVIAVSDLARRFCVWLGVEESKVFVVPNGIDLSIFRPGRGRKEIRRKLGIREGPLVVTASRLTRRKGIHNLITAFSQVKKIFPHAKLVVAGAGGELNRLRVLARKLGIEESVVLLGPVPHTKMPELLAAADVCVVPSELETFSLLALESLATGTPFIGPESRGISSLIQHGKNGLLVPPNDVDELGKTILKVLEDKKLRKSLQKNGLKTVGRDFGWDVCAKRTLEVYKTITEKRVE